MLPLALRWSLCCCLAVLLLLWIVCLLSVVRRNRVIFLTTAGCSCGSSWQSLCIFALVSLILGIARWLRNFGFYVLGGRFLAVLLSFQEIRLVLLRNGICQWIVLRPACQIHSKASRMLRISCVTELVAIPMSSKYCAHWSAFLTLSKYSPMKPIKLCSVLVPIIRTQTFCLQSWIPIFQWIFGRPFVGNDMLESSLVCKTVHSLLGVELRLTEC